MENVIYDQETAVLDYVAKQRATHRLNDAASLALERALFLEIEHLQLPELTSEEIFMIAVRRVEMQNRDMVKAVNWKPVLLVLTFAFLAGTFMQIPSWLGSGIDQPGSGSLYLRNLSFFILPLAALYFGLIQSKSARSSRTTYITIAATFVTTFLAINLFPWIANGQTEMLSAIHLPILLWLVVGILYLGKSWRSSEGRMAFIRFTGEALMLGVLVVLGLMVLLLFTLMIFSAISIDLENIFSSYLVPYGISAAFFVTLYWTGRRSSSVETIAPVLAKVFSPLFLLSLVGFLLAMAVQGKSPFVEREFLIGFDVMLVIVLGLVTYTLSSRRIDAPFGYQDSINFVLIAVALIIDGVALVEIVKRLTEYGASANKVAALGENLILLVDLGGYAYLTLRAWQKKTDFMALVKWQTRYMTIVALWTAVVALIFPIFFSFN
ncbi:MAG: hypothetical protein PHC86_05915 [Eubacteriales bacterium]|nr:hypothetical protein [Eubacteriales bacterium]